MWVSSTVLGQLVVVRALRSTNEVAASETEHSSPPRRGHNRLEPVLAVIKPPHREARVGRADRRRLPASIIIREVE